MTQKVVFPAFASQIFRAEEMRQLVSALELRFQSLESEVQTSQYPTTELGGVSGDYAEIGHTHVESDITDLGSYLSDLTAQSIFSLADVAGSPAVGQTLVWNGSAFVPSSSGASLSLSDLTDVSDSLAPTDLQVLQYNATQNQWVSATLTSLNTLIGLTDTNLGTTQQYDLLYNFNGSLWVDTAGLLRFNPALGLSLGNNLAIGWDLSTSGEVALLNFDGSDEFNIGNSAYAANLAATITTVTGQMAFTNPVADLTTPIIYIRTDADNVERRLINFWEGTVENGFYLQAEYAPNEPDNFLTIGCDKITGTDRAFAIGQDGSFIAFQNKPYGSNLPGFEFDRGAEQVNAYYGRFFTIGRSSANVDLSLDAGTNFSAYTGYWEGPESFGRVYGFKHGYDGANNRYVLIRKDGGADALVFQVPRTTGILDFQLEPTLLGVPLGNATHTGEVTGATALTVEQAAITNKTELLYTSIEPDDEVLVSDTSGASLGRADVSVLTDAGYF